MRLTDAVASLNKRVGNLEGKGLDANAPLARINKHYDVVSILSTLRAKRPKKYGSTLSFTDSQQASKLSYIPGVDEAQINFVTTAAPKTVIIANEGMMGSMSVEEEVTIEE